MRQSCSIVIGAGFGDEGKGHYVDILCNRPNTLNVRFNGGAQASHTVVTPDGERYPFSNVGAGTFTGAATYLSAYYLVNPVYFVLELSSATTKNSTFEVVCGLYVPPVFSRVAIL